MSAPPHTKKRSGMAVKVSLRQEMFEMPIGQADRGIKTSLLIVGNNTVLCLVDDSRSYIRNAKFCHPQLVRQYLNLPLL